MTLLRLGATGLVGRDVLTQATADPRVERRDGRVGRALIDAAVTAAAGHRVIASEALA